MVSMWRLLRKLCGICSPYIDTRVTHDRSMLVSDFIPCLSTITDNVEEMESIETSLGRKSHLAFMPYWKADFSSV